MQKYIFEPPEEPEEENSNDDLLERIMELREKTAGDPKIDSVKIIRAMRDLEDEDD